MVNGIKPKMTGMSIRQFKKLKNTKTKEEFIQVLYEVGMSGEELDYLRNSDITFSELMNGTESVGSGSDKTKELNEVMENGDFILEEDPGFQYELAQSAEEEGKYEESLEWYRKSADQGNLHSLGILGLKYMVGDGVPVNYDEAEKCFRKIQKRDRGLGEFFLSRLYFEKKNDKKALEYLKRSSENGNENALHQLSIFYLNGEWLVKQDKKEAERLFNVLKDSMDQEDFEDFVNTFGGVYEDSGSKWKRLIQERSPEVTTFYSATEFMKGEISWESFKEMNEEGLKNWKNDDSEITEEKFRDAWGKSCLFSSRETPKKDEDGNYGMDIFPDGFEDYINQEIELDELVNKNMDWLVDATLITEQISGKGNFISDRYMTAKTEEERQDVLNYAMLFNIGVGLTFVIHKSKENEEHEVTESFETVLNEIIKPKVKEYIEKLNEDKSE